ncbi:TonB-dependent outer membrane receptor, SusC/RagA subfamily, signature region [Filimonas lacunae]|uniref:TonB-dependent outer membrane receptor, SusC/RagA subfamily, signature region n=1 Tax=Filimonas lacunae TaxID=477680 RepID=A0A173MF50_9BACT|nr:TonB-dependent receptor plug domain-containing protein [Filimonas lacunae]BAV06224.1 outer membrane protein SusC, starch binding [Filimonas lacunae]SIT25346.1 TonB-dependent outer membrane receptor, SusC/RagA subfamily, signature region [Filimonas lacunae]
MKKVTITCFLLLLLTCSLSVITYAQLTQYNTYKEKIYIQTDHVMYAPGSEMYFKLYLVQASTQLPSTVSEIVFVDIISPSGAVIKTLRLPSSQGNATGSYYFPENTAGGIYTIRAYTRWMKNEKESTWFTKEITLQKVISPRVLMKLDFPRKGYGPGDTVTASYAIRNLNDEPITHFPVKYTLSENGEVVKTGNFTTDNAGKAFIQCTLSDTLHTTDALLNITVVYDSYTESVSRNIPVSLNKVDLQLLPEGGTFIAGLPARIAFIAINEYGKPVDVKGVVKDSKGNICAQLESYHNGMGAFDFTASTGEKYYAELATPSGIHQHYPLPHAQEQGTMMHLVTGDSTIHIRLTASQAGQVILSAGSRNKISFTRTCSLQPGEQWIEIPISLFQPGINRFTLHTLQGQPFAERIAFLHPGKQLHVYITTDKKEYSPREKVTLYVTTLDETNTPVPSDCSLSVIDDKLWSLADDKQDHIVSWLMMSSELRGKIEEPQFYFKRDEPKSVTALDFVMLTHGYRYFDYSDSVIKRQATAWFPDPSYIIAGTITDTAGKPLAGTVYLVCKNSYTNSADNKIIEQQTGNDGLFFFSNPPQAIDNYMLIAKSNRKKQLIKIKTEQFDAANIATYSQYLTHKFGRRLPVANNNYGLNTIPPPAIEAPATTASSDIMHQPSRLEDVQVIAYGTVAKRLQSSSVTTIRSESVVINNPLLALQGRVPGLSITNANGLPGGGTKVTIQGQSSLAGYNEPLWVIDDVPVEKLDPNLNPAAINNITVIKDAALASIYGSRAANGVIIVTTKLGYRNRRSFRLNRGQYYFTTTPFFSNGHFDEARQFYMPYYATTATTIKNDFRETLYWNPIVQTDSCGEAVVTFFNSDATTTFRAIAEGMGSNGSPGHTEATYSSQPTISIDAKIPPYFSTGDTAYIPLNVKNNREDTFLATIQVAITQPLQTGWFDKRLYILPDSSTQVFIPLTATSATKGKINITINNYRDTSTLQLPVTALDKGYPVTTILSGNRSVTQTIPVMAPAPGTLHASLSYFTNLEGQLLEGLESMLAEPHGCFEQTSSATYPNLYILKYLKATGKANTSLQARAEKYLQEGYDRLISYETREKGFEWFGHTPASETLTAYGLMEFTDMQEFIKVDANMLARTKAFLLGRRNGKGGFTIKHNQFSSVPADVSSLYIVYALTQAGIGNEIQPEYQAALATALQSNDTYQTAMMALAAISLKDTASYNQLLKTLPATWVKPHSSFVYSRGNSLKVEAASLYALALARAPKPDLAIMAQQMNIILAGKNYFGYGSTQATVLALKAIMTYTQTLNKAIDTGAVIFTLNNHTIQPGNNIDSLIKTGNNQFTVQYNHEKDALPYNVKLSYYSLQPPNSPDAEIQLKTQLHPTKAHVGETVRLDISVANTKDIFQPMTLAKIGIPAGLTVQPWQLKQLIEQKQVAYYEIFDNYLVLYWMGLANRETLKVSLDLKAEIPGKYTGRASNTYLYYTPELQYWNAGLCSTILP